MPVSLPAALLCVLLPGDSPETPTLSEAPTRTAPPAIAGVPTLSAAPQATPTPDPGGANFVPAEIAAADAPPLSALGTLCVVALAERRFEAASPHFSAVHAGRTYFFASEQALSRFRDAPDRYAPAWCGMDPVAYLDEEILAEGAVLRRHAGRFYLFTSVENWNVFRAAPGRYAR
ncbi:YHS domain-containing protein [Alienimonas sp. DA493]|uniref:YHS domain-containing protein n=1 Tax=Alienimonas sp. DA493 TaxID=3373605 RepID=UPI0037548925